jgi:uncharacterized protein YkwD
MLRPIAIAIALSLSLAACEAPPLQPDGSAANRVYRIGDGSRDAVQLRMLDAVNALRRARNVPPLVLNAQLNAAAATHARDMSVQNRPWNFGSDGSSPILRAQRVGYAGVLLGELISETYETELQTLAVWMEDPVNRGIVLDPAARDMGFDFYQDPSGKIWWALEIGGPGLSPIMGGS